MNKLKPRTEDEPSADELLPEPATVSLTSSLPATAAPAAIPAKGSVIGGKYGVEGLLGEGGMGVVLAAVHLRLGRRVALKLMRSPADQQALRLVREARAAGRLESPYVAALLDVEELPDGRPFLVLERLQGETLAERLRRRGPLSVAEAADVLGQAALGLATAHAAGVIHRDVKPSNLFLTLGEGGRPRVKLIDFGIAKSADPHDVTLTTDAMTLGSPVYMSPEQTRGARDVDARADVWSLGVTLYEALSGALPFPGSSVQAVAAAVAADPPASLEARCPDLPRAVLRLVDACLEKDPARRCPSAHAFLRALAPHAGAAGAALLDEARALGLSDPTPATPPRPGGRVLALALAAAGLALVAAVGLGARGLRRAPAAPASAALATRSFSPVNARRITFDEGCEEYPWWSPDGRTIVFDAASGKDTRVLALDLAGGPRRVLSRGAGFQMSPSASPRGDLIAYLALSSSANGTYVAAPDGSSPRRLSPHYNVRPSFSPDGAFVWAGDSRRPERIDVRTGETARALEPPDAARLTNLLELADGRVIGRAEANNEGIGVVLFAAGQARSTWLLRAEVDEVVEVTPDGADVLVARPSEGLGTDLWRVPLDGSPAARVPSASVQPTKGLRISPDGARVTWSNCRHVEHIARTTAGPTAGSLAFAPGARRSDWVDTSATAVAGTSRLLAVSTRTGSSRPCLVDIEEREPARCLDTGGLDPLEPAISPDGQRYVFFVAGKGLFLAPLDGSERPRLLLAAPPGDAFRAPVFSPDGREVIFDHSVQQGLPVASAVSVLGGPVRRFLDDTAHAAAFSPRGDRVAYLAWGKELASRAMVMDLATKHARPLADDLPDAQSWQPAWSASGARVSVIQGWSHAIEVDVAARKVARRLDAGNDEIGWLTYVGEELVVIRGTWIGDLWVADLR